MFIHGEEFEIILLKLHFLNKESSSIIVKSI